MLRIRKWKSASAVRAAERRNVKFDKALESRPPFFSLVRHGNAAVSRPDDVDRGGGGPFSLSRPLGPMESSRVERSEGPRVLGESASQVEVRIVDGVLRCLQLTILR